MTTLPGKYSVYEAYPDGCSPHCRHCLDDTPYDDAPATAERPASRPARAPGQLPGGHAAQHHDRPGISPDTSHDQERSS